jgi:hypothetical protein
MPTKRSGTRRPVEPAAELCRMGTRAAALLERQGLPLGVTRERDWRQLYIRGKTPEDAAREAEGELLEHPPAH